jgi:ribosome-associated toxin RatA of RatAB toxin-antitoxin module
MSSFEQEIEIQAAPADLFDLTQDYDRRLLWDPFLKEARLVGNAKRAGVGERAWCVARNGLGMETEYVTFNRPRQTAVKMTRGPWIIAKFAGSWRFKEVEPGRTRVIFRYNIAARPSWLGFAFNPVLRLVFAHELGKRLKGLKHAAEHTDILNVNVTAEAAA